MTSSNSPAETPPPYLDPQVAHLIDARHLLSLLPHLSQTDLDTIRREFAMHISTQRGRTRYATWQDAWNAWTGATPHRPGQITYTPHRCPTCHGRGFDHRHPGRNLARTGHPMICGDCRGNRRGQSTRQTARYVAPRAEAERRQ